MAVGKPSIFAALADAFIAALGDERFARIEGGPDFPGFAIASVPVIIRESRESGLAEDVFTAVEGVTHRCAIRAADAAGIEEGMRLVLLPRAGETGEMEFRIRGRPDDGRAMVTLLLEEDV